MKYAPLFALLVAGVVGCPSEPPVPTPVDPPPWCTDGRAGFRLSASRTEPIGVYPDDHWTLPADTRTGLQVHLEPEQHPDLLADFPEQWGSLFDAVSTLDGWGLTAGIVFRFAFGLDAASIDPEDVGIVAFTEDGPVHYGVDVQVLEFPDTVVLRPHRPLPHATPVAAAIFQGATSTDGTCVRPGEHLRELLSPASELEPGVPAHVLAPRYQEAMQAFGKAPEDIAAMTVFTTQSTTLDSVAVAADVRERDYAWTLGECAPDSLGSRCTGTIEVQDYRGADRVTPLPFEATPQSSYDLPTNIWLPDGDGPFPIALVGHGLGSNRNSLDGFVSQLRTLGIAVVSTDALEHGDHPTNSQETSNVVGVMTFFAIETSPLPSIDPLRLRDNFRQSSWDRIQVVEAVRDGIDADGDGDVDLDAERMLYVGQSLGGMMGSETMALVDDFLGGFFIVAGGRLTQVVTEADAYGPLMDLMIPAGYGDDDLKRIIPVVQAVADAGDPMVWASWIVNDRLVGDPDDPPQLLSHYVLGDETVNNVSNTNHAGGLGLPLVGREIWPQPTLVPSGGPVSGNLPNGGTAAVQLFDEGARWDDPNGDSQSLGHGSVLLSWESWSVWYPFLEMVALGQPGTVSDPYAD